MGFPLIPRGAGWGRRLVLSTGASVCPCLTQLVILAFIRETFLSHGWPQGDSELCLPGNARGEVKWQHSKEYNERRKDWNDTIQRLILSLFPLFSCLHLSVVHSTVVVLQSHQGYPGIAAGKETPIVSANADRLLLQIPYLFQPRCLLLSNSVPLLFLGRFFPTGFWTQTYMTPVFSNERCLRLHDAFIASMKMTVFIWKGNWNNTMGSFSNFVRAQFSMTIEFLS